MSSYSNASRADSGSQDRDRGTPQLQIIHLGHAFLGVLLLHPIPPRWPNPPCVNAQGHVRLRSKVAYYILLTRCKVDPLGIVEASLHWLVRTILFLALTLSVPVALIFGLFAIASVLLAIVITLIHIALDIIALIVLVGIIVFLLSAARRNL